MPVLMPTVPTLLILSFQCLFSAIRHSEHNTGIYDAYYVLEQACVMLIMPIYNNPYNACTEPTMSELHLPNSC